MLSLMLSMMFSSLLWPLAAPARAESQGAPDAPILAITRGGESRTLSLREIEETGLRHVEMRHPEGLEGRFSGVNLDDFLAANGLDEARRVRFIADDGYTTFLTPAERREKRYLMVTRLDGEPIGPDQFGPLMLVVPEEAEAVLAGTAPLTRWIWALREVSAR
ncbi:molybdopterin-dependent oxidoreductase [Halomonas aestuarii]|nr:molybdopterin-dependent oxidoreductase [Halomonas aestuarii]